jgi:cytochrome c553
MIPRINGHLITAQGERRTILKTKSAACHEIDGNPSRQSPQRVDSRPLLLCRMECSPVHLLSSSPLQLFTDHVPRQNSVGNVVLFNRRNNQIQLSTNAHSLENGVDETASAPNMCPTCHRPLHEESAQSQSPAFMDSEYFRMLSSVGSDGGSNTHKLPATDRVPDHPNVPEERPRGSLPRSAFNQGYFEQYSPRHFGLTQVFCCT